MSRYIDIETIKPRQYENSEVELGVLAYDYDEVDAMPFLDIVRCKECRWWDIDNTGEIYCSLAKGLCDIDADCYCSYGERSE